MVLDCVCVRPDRSGSTDWQAPGPLGRPHHHHHHHHHLLLLVSTHTGLLFFLLVIPNFLILLVSSYTHTQASLLLFHHLCPFLPQPRSLTSSQAFPFFALINRLLPPFSHSSSMFTLTTDKLLRECCYLYFLVGLIINSQFHSGSSRLVI